MNKELKNQHELLEKLFTQKELNHFEFIFLTQMISIKEKIGETNELLEKILLNLIKLK